MVGGLAGCVHEGYREFGTGDVVSIWEREGLLERTGRSFCCRSL